MSQLNVAIKNGQLNVAIGLITQSANKLKIINGSKHSASPLYNAITFYKNDPINYHNFIHFLIQNGADVNNRGGHITHTPLICACIFNHYDVIKLLLENGANPNLTETNSEFSPLYFTISYSAMSTDIENKMVDICKLLVKYKANITDEIIKLSKDNSELVEFFTNVKMLLLITTRHSKKYLDRTKNKQLLNLDIIKILKIYIIKI